jgi:hypothetical protein
VLRCPRRRLDRRQLFKAPGVAIDHCRFALQENALSSSDGTVYLSGGGAVDGWIPPSLRNEHGGGLAGWSESDIVQLLKSARNPRSGSFGGMNDVVVHSMQHLNDGDLSGSTLPQRRLRLPPLTMAPYAWILTDQDIADVVSFIPTSWGNADAVVTSSRVTALRKRAK